MRINCTYLCDTWMRLYCKLAYHGSAGNVITSYCMMNLLSYNNVMSKRNSFLKQKAVNLFGLEPDHQVLEICFGPDIGLSHAHVIVKSMYKSLNLINRYHTKKVSGA